MNYEEQYRDKLTTAEEAVKIVNQVTGWIIHGA